MNMDNIAAFDLNLLIVFDTIMSERSATRAGVRLGMTQPAVSHALRRLRLLFDDPLFVRTPRGLDPTPFAEQLSERVRPVVAGAEAALRLGKAFDPLSSAREFVLGMADYSSVVMLPQLLPRFATAPGVRLRVKSCGYATGLALLDEGGVDMVVGNFPAPPPHIQGEELFEERFVCAARRGVFGKTMTKKRYLAAGHVQISTSGSPFGMIDAVLAEAGARRDVRVTVAHFLAAPLVLANSSLLATEPERLFDVMEGGWDLQRWQPPFTLPGFAVTMHWHARFDDDPAHAWLRDVVRQCGKSIAASARIYD
ncbi:MAG: LysR family transcriptional regulator [Planctomycetaceae bacterium]|nr:LysR family transcriptional regulator [Planctomycetaceae bacterium]